MSASASSLARRSARARSQAEPLNARHRRSLVRALLGAGRVLGGLDRWAEAQAEASAAQALAAADLAADPSNADATRQLVNVEQLLCRATARATRALSPACRSALARAESLAAAQTVWVGVDNKGLRGLLPADQKPLADKIDAAYDASLKLFNDNTRSLNELLADDAGRAQLDAIYDSLNVVHRLHEGELAKALGIQLGFNANDGD